MSPRTGTSRSPLKLVGVVAIAVAVAVCTPLFAMGASNGESSKTSQLGFGADQLSVEDRLEIQALYARYSQDLDNGDAKDLAEKVFAPDGRFHDPSVCYVGSTQLRELATSFGSPKQDHWEQHLPYNIAIWGKGDRAYGHAYVSVLEQRLGHWLAGRPPTHLGDGHLHRHVRRDPWRMADPGS